jgi:hypothetical protein
MLRVARRFRAADSHSVWINFWGAGQAVVQKLTSVNFRVSRVELKSDGSFVFEQVPDLRNAVSAQSISKFTDLSGTWALAKHDGHWCLMLNYDAGNSYIIVSLLNAEMPYGIEFPVGDPDDGSVLRYIQSPL